MYNYQVMKAPRVVMIVLAGVLAAGCGKEKEGGSLRVLALNLPQAATEQWLADNVFTPRTGIEVELERQGLAEVPDRTDVLEDVGQALVEQPLERQPLNRDQIGQVEGVVQLSEGIAFWGQGACGQRLLLGSG